MDTFKILHVIDWHVQVWLGYQQSLRPSHAGLTLNVDMAATAFLEPQMVIDFLQKAVGLRSPQDFAHLNPMQHRKATKAITGLRVGQTTYAIWSNLALQGEVYRGNWLR